jgi:CRISPR-associated protein Cas6
MPETAGGEMVDVAFRLPGGRLPVDHAYALFTAVCGVLPWFADEPAARLHQVHTAATGSGWMRPDASPGEELHLSRRTKLRLRVPLGRAEETLALAGRVMDVGGYELAPGAGKLVPLVPAETLLARHVLCEDEEDETRLGRRLAEALTTAGVAGAGLILGRAQRISTPETILRTRSVVVTNLDPGGAMVLLRDGIGAAGKLGCGIFIPYKRID